MGRIAYTTGIGIPHRSFEEEFLAHRKCSEWWYCTGYLRDESGGLFGYQFTLAKVRIFGLRFHLLICSLTDCRKNEHYNTQTPIFLGSGVETSAELLSVKGRARIEFSPNGKSSLGTMRLRMAGADFDLDVEMDSIKAPVWHCDDGVLQMGIPGDKERTYYYSFTNLAARGRLSIRGRSFGELRGKAWFDRQGGTYTLTDRRTCWEWFSIRFFDDREAMLFAFPQDGYYDGTYIEADGSYRRMGDYSIEATEATTFEGKEFSSAWKLRMNGEDYAIAPLARGMFNVFFFELLADVKDEDGRSVGYCFVELLPGVRNETSGLDAFKKK